VRKRGARLKEGLEALVGRYPDIFAGVRGTGLMLGLLCAAPNTAVQKVCVGEGLLTVAAGENVLRLVPPLVVTEADIDEGLLRLGRAADVLRSHHITSSLQDALQ
jgi:acetylornithine/N-succinyldiaminopimelate aminotransferase